MADETKKSFEDTVSDITEEFGATGFTAKKTAAADILKGNIETFGEDDNIVEKLKPLQPDPPIDTSTITDEVIDNTSSLPRGECTGVLKPEVSPAPTPSVTPSPTPIGPTPPPTPAPIVDDDDEDGECTLPGSSCFRVKKWKGCDDQSCEDKVCNVFKSCCNKTWNKKCKKKANQLCNKCECDEDPSALFFKNKKAGEPVLKTCDWLDEQPSKQKQKFCKKYASFGDYDPARITCPLACNLKFCQNDQSIFS